MNVEFNKWNSKVEMTSALVFKSQSESLKNLVYTKKDTFNPKNLRNQRLIKTNSSKIGQRNLFREYS